MAKKVLIITYYWPPAGGPGVQRWLKFVKYLGDFDIQPIVYVPENPEYPIIDSTLTKEVPKDLVVLKQPIKEPYKFARFLSRDTKSISKGIIPEEKKQSMIHKLLLYIRGNYFIPDARKNWIAPSVKYLKKYIETQGIKTIITTGPPHSLHLIGLRLKREMNLYWLADFRDPWTTIGYQRQLRLNKASVRKHKELERQVLNESDKIIVTSYNTGKTFECITNQPITVITNGYDSEKITPPDPDKKFSFSHIGSLLSKRNPDVLWKVLADIIAENKIFGSLFQLNLVGTVSEEVLQSLDYYHLTPYLNLVGYIDHNSAVAFQRRSSVLVLIEIDSKETKCIVPGKLFEYMAAHRPIIALGPDDSDVEKILTETNTGHYFRYSEYDALKKILLAHFEAFQNNTLESHPVGIQKYHRRALTQQLAALITKD